MQDKLNISKASIQDIANIVTLVNGAYRGEGSKAGWTTEADLLDGIRITEQGLQAILDKEEATILKAEDATGKIVGCVHLELQADALYLGMLTVNPEMQNAGIGKKLLSASEAFAQASNRNLIHMSVITVRDTLIAWYMRHGYQQTGKKLPFPDDPKFGLPKQPLEFMILEKHL